MLEPDVEDNYDVIIHIGKESREFNTRSAVLCCGSQYFNSILSAKDIDKRNGKYVIKIPNITPQVFDVIIKYINTGYVDLTNKTGIEILNIMIASDDLKLNQLIKLAEFVIESNHQFLQNENNPVEILQIIYHHKVFDNIREFILKMICLNPTKVLFNHVTFVNLPISILEVILKRDDLSLIEINVWENLIKWGLAQDQNLNNKDVSKWNQEEFEVFKRILHKLILLIRFYEISSEDYYDKVRPYEEILPKELRDDIFRYHLVPGYEPTLNKLPRYSKYRVDSVLINQNHIALFASWIGRKEVSFKYVKSIPYEFNLILRGSQDGFDHMTFHDKCNDKGANIVVVKIKNSYQIVGGYNPFDWSGGRQSCGFKSTSDSFIFSFSDYKNIKTGKIGRVINTQYAVWGCSNLGYGPLFGPNLNGSGDLMSLHNKWSSVTNSYPHVNIPRYFEIDDYEVFQVKNCFS